MSGERGGIRGADRGRRRRRLVEGARGRCSAYARAASCLLPLLDEAKARRWCLVGWGPTLGLEGKRRALGDRCPSLENAVDGRAGEDRRCV